MAKLHELLAVEGTLGKVSGKLLLESMRTFAKENLFGGMHKRITLYADADKHLEEGEEQHIKLATTVDENLDYLINPVSQYLDAVLQKDCTNQIAKADIVINGTVIASNIPATFLLGLETRLTEIRKVYEAIPTLAPGISWVPDSTQRDGVFKAEHDIKAFKTATDMDYKVAYEATEQHPAQIKDVKRTVNIGMYATTKWSGAVTPHEKAARLTRFDQLLQAVKEARQRANCATVVSSSIGQSLFSFING